jgi:tRNA modification GTPase
MLDAADTIAAVASPSGTGYRGIIRLSGPRSWAIASAGFTADRLGTSSNHARRQEGRLRLEGLRPALPATLVLWKAPRSYTGQDVAEIHTVGCPPLISLVLANTLSRGARLAEPGEFTLRAFLSGRIDLTQAEAVLGVIEARTRPQLDAALEQLAGGIAGPIRTLRDRLLEVLAHIEANLDFTEERDIDPLGRSELAGFLAKGADELSDLNRRLRGRDRPRGHPRVVLVGPPNAGKSRLFNALVGENQALVSPIPGTTRDYLSAQCLCESLVVELIDTAGEELPRTTIDAQAQAFRAEQTVRADLLLTCMPVGSNFAADSLIGATASDRPQLLVRTKCDLASDHLSDLKAIVTSAATGQGLEALRRAIASLLYSRQSDGDLPATTGARCRGSILSASDALVAAAESVALSTGDELVSIELRLAVDELGKIVGTVVTDDILDRIFARFCIGK